MILDVHAACLFFIVSFKHGGWFRIHLQLFSSCQKCKIMAHTLPRLGDLEKAHAWKGSTNFFPFRAAPVVRISGWEFSETFFKLAVARLACAKSSLCTTLLVAAP